LSELTPDDVREILRLVDEAGVEELELDTGRFSLRFRRNEQPEERRGGALGEITAPMVGTFYRGPAPGEPPYVEVGTAVEPETQVCILEVMKLMNGVPAGVRGTIAEVCVQDGAAVQFGDVLFRVST
jgi:acetyl-CoA carboxylase biotin carboxyl carrier protein